VRCRPVDDSRTRRVDAQHCYIVVKDANGLVSTITGGEAIRRPSGWLKVWTLPGDPIPGNSTADAVFYGPSQGDRVCNDVDCLKRRANQIDAMRLPYYFLGQNSNTAVAEMMRICGLPMVLPPQAVGGNLRLSYANAVR